MNSSPVPFSVITGRDPGDKAGERLERLAELGVTGKAFAVLEAVSASAGPATMSEIIRVTGMTKPTAHRIVNLLVDMGLLGRDFTGNGFIGGANLVKLAHRIVAAAAPQSLRHAVLRGLSEEIGETCNYGMLDGPEVVYLDRVEAKWPLGLRFDAGSHVPAHCTAIGKLLLSRLAEGDLAALLQIMPRARYTANTITALRPLREALDEIRRTGIGTDNQEFMHGVVCVAVPVATADGQCLGGIALSAPEARMTLADILKFVPRMRDVAAKFAATYRTIK